MHDQDLAQVRPRVMPQRAARRVAKMGMDGRCRRENKCGLDGERMGAEVAEKGDQTRVSHQGGRCVANNIEGTTTSTRTGLSFSVFEIDTIALFCLVCLSLKLG